MTALCRAYDTIAAAERAVAALLGGGVPGDDVRLLMGAQLHDARREPHGGFAGGEPAGGRVGAFAGGGSPAAARGGFAGPASGPEGVFGAADRDVVVSWPDGREHGRVTGHRELERVLTDAGLDEAAARDDVAALHEGRVLVLVTSGRVSAGRAAALLDAA